MRIITGKARGKRLQTPEGLHTRPTTERVKESVFSIVQWDIEGRKALDLFGAEHCEPNSGEQDFTGRVLVLSPDTLRESCWQPENQLWLASGGFGCRPHARGRSVFCTCLGDGETTRWNRSEFVGIIRDECIPDWAAEKLAELRQSQNAPAMGEMTM
mgnify:CR=1 FL=1